MTESLPSLTLLFDGSSFVSFFLSARPHHGRRETRKADEKIDPERDRDRGNQRCNLELSENQKIMWIIMFACEDYFFLLKKKALICLFCASFFFFPSNNRNIHAHFLWFSGANLPILLFLLSL